MNKTIYTSYLNKRGNWNELSITTVQVCRWIFMDQPPCNMELSMLHPAEQLIRTNQTGKIAWEEYTRIYNEMVLDKLDANDIVALLPEKSVLMCHEIDPSTCHRSLIGTWIEKHTGIKVPEWKNPHEMRKEQIVDSLCSF